MPQYVFKERGVTVPLWSFSDIESARASLQQLHSSGATQVIVDFHLEAQDLNDSLVVWEDDRELSNLTQVVSEAKALGLKVAIKPIVIIAETIVNWQELDPDNKGEWFSNYQQRLHEALDAQLGNVDTLVLTNELRTLTTNPDNDQYWVNLIADLREHYDVGIGFNAGGLLGDAPGLSEYELISPTLYDAVDFIGISAYPRVDGSMPEDFRNAWYSDSFGINQIFLLQEFALHTKKPIYFTELGVASVEGGNTYFYSSKQDQEPVIDFGYSDAFYEGTFSAFADDLTGIIDGVFIYSWSLSDTPAPEDNFWNVNRQSAVVRIETFFSDGLNIDTTYLSTSSADKIFGSGLSDTITVQHAGSDTYAFGGDDVIIQVGSATSEDRVSLQVTVNGDILDGIAPILNVVVNGRTIGEIRLDPVIAGRNSNFGDLPFSTQQTFSFFFGLSDEIQSVRIFHTNDEYQGLGLDRNATIHSMYFDGVHIASESFIYIPEYAEPQTGGNVLFDSGYIELTEAALDELNQTRSMSVIDGGAGIDTAVYSGNQASYTLMLTPTSTSITDRRADGNGTDQLIDIEFLDFDKEAFPFDFNLTQFGAPTGLSAADFESFIELYIAYFNRAPDAVGLAFWGSAFANGMSLEEIAAQFAPQPETVATYPMGTSNVDFATAVYTNVLGRVPDQAGLDFWAGVLNAGAASRDQFILEILRGVEAGTSDRAYLDNKVDVGAYFAVHKGMSDVANAIASMALYDGTKNSIDQAVTSIDDYYQAALHPENGEFLLQVVGVLDNALGD